MSALTVIHDQDFADLPDLIARSARHLAEAKTSAEILEAKEGAAFAYDMAKRLARLAKAKDAHDDVIARARRAQADAVEIEVQAKIRLSVEYTAAQERGEVAERGKPVNVPDGNIKPATTDEIGISRKEIHEARRLQEAEELEPGLVRRVLQDALEAREEPSRALLNREVAETIAFRKGLPTASEARKKAKEAGPGTVFLGRDGKFHAATTPDGQRQKDAFLAVFSIVDDLEGVAVADVVAGCPPIARAKLCQRASYLADFFSDIMEAANGRP